MAKGVLGNDPFKRGAAERDGGPAEKAPAAHAEAPAVKEQAPAGKGRGASAKGQAPGAAKAGSGAPGARPAKAGAKSPARADAAAKPAAKKAVATKAVAKKAAAKTAAGGGPKSAAGGAGGAKSERPPAAPRLPKGAPPGAASRADASAPPAAAPRRAAARKAAPDAPSTPALDEPVRHEPVRHEPARQAKDAAPGGTAGAAADARPSPEPEVAPARAQALPPAPKDGPAARATQAPAEGAVPAPSAATAAFPEDPAGVAAQAAPHAAAPAPARVAGPAASGGAGAEAAPSASDAAAARPVEAPAAPSASTAPSPGTARSASTPPSPTPAPSASPAPSTSPAPSASPASSGDGAQEARRDAAPAGAESGKARAAPEAPSPPSRYEEAQVADDAEEASPLRARPSAPRSAQLTLPRDVRGGGAGLAGLLARGVEALSVAREVLGGALTGPAVREAKQAAQGLVTAVRSGLGAGASRAVDAYGRDEDLVRELSPLLDFLYTRYWRVSVEGAEHVPAGPAILVANHSGTVPFDGPVLHHALLRERPDLKESRWLLEDQVFYAPFFGTLFNRLGALRASPENALRLLEERRPVIVFPEGAQGLGKLYRERYQLKRFGRGGFVKLALRAGVPVVPVAVVGAEDSTPLLAKLPGSLLGLPYVPLAPLGPLPLPAKWAVRFGAPVDLEGLGADAADRLDVVQRLTERTRERIQEMLTQLLRERPGVFTG